MSDIEYIPANPLINSAGLNERNIMNTATRVQPRETVVIPPPPFDERVEVKPVERRRFNQPQQAVQDNVFRTRR